MVQRVVEQALKASGLDAIVVTTDDARVVEHVKPVRKW